MLTSHNNLRGTEPREGWLLARGINLSHLCRSNRHALLEIRERCAWRIQCV